MVTEVTIQFYYLRSLRSLMSPGLLNTTKKNFIRIKLGRGSIVDHSDNPGMIGLPCGMFANLTDQ